jgi:hypothetical protein
MPGGSLIRINIVPLCVSGSVSLKHRPRQDVAIGTHVPLTLSTRVGNPSCHRRCRHAWGTHLNNIMTLPGGKHRLVRTHFTIRYSMGRYRRGQSLQPITMPQEASLPTTYLTNHHCDKTRRRLTGKPYPLAVGRCKGEARLSTSWLHERRHRRQVKTSLRNLPRN